MKNFLDFIEHKKTYQHNIARLNEAFLSKDMNKVHDLITKLFKKNISDKVVMDKTSYSTVSNGQECESYFWYLFKDGKLDMGWSFNYAVNTKSHEVYSIDFYTGNNLTDFWCNSRGTQTDITIFTMGSSIAYFLPMCYHIVNNHDFSLDKKKAANISKQIFNESATVSDFYIGAQCYKIYECIPSSTIYNIFNLNIGNINEANRELQDHRWALKKKRDDAWQKKTDTKDEKDIEEWKKIRDEYDAVVKAIKGGAETIGDLEMAIKKNVSALIKLPEEDAAQKEIEEEHEHPDFAFSKMKKYVSLVIKGLQPSLIICGAPGVGKTYNVKKQLKDAGYIENHNMATIKGKCSPRVLYATLYDYRDPGDIVIIDDADGLVGPKAPEDCINILKAALDSTADDEGRLVSYGIASKIFGDDGEPLPKQFYYKGGVIVMTNYQVGALDTALRGRSYIQDMKFTPADVLERIKTLMPEMFRDKIGMKAKIKAYDYLQELLDNKSAVDISMRNFGLCATIYQASMYDQSWTEDETRSMIKEQMKHQAARAPRSAHH